MYFTYSFIFMFVIVRIGVTFLCRNVCLIFKKITRMLWGGKGVHADSLGRKGTQRIPLEGKGPTHIPLEGEGPHVFPWRGSDPHVFSF